MEVISQKRSTCSEAAIIVIGILSTALLGGAIAFAYLFLSGGGKNYLLGTLLALEFLLAGIAVVFYARFFISFREVAEDREEELLW